MNDGERIGVCQDGAYCRTRRLLSRHNTHSATIHAELPLRHATASQMRQEQRTSNIILRNEVSIFQ